MTKIIFIYKANAKLPKVYEVFCTKIYNLLKNIIVLPEQLEIQFEIMGQNVYGMTMLDPRFPNRIRLNQELSLEEIILPLVHELIHLNQIYTNRLSVRTGGRILWENQVYKVDSMKLNYQDYLDLPWEQDANEKQIKIIEFIKRNSKKINAEIKKELHFTQNTIQNKPSM
jgi:hypothetical protein